MMIFLLLALNIYQPNSVTDTYMCLCDKCVSMCMYMHVAVPYIQSGLYWSTLLKG